MSGQSKPSRTAAAPVPSRDRPGRPGGAVSLGLKGQGHTQPDTDSSLALHVSMSGSQGPEQRHISLSGFMGAYFLNEIVKS